MEYLDLEEWERQETLEALGEALRLSNVYQRFKYIYFVSKSKGRGRERKYHKEIELVKILSTQNCVSMAKFESTGDRIASEVDKKVRTVDDLIIAIRKLPH